MADSASQQKKSKKGIVIAVFVFLVLFYFCTGFFVVQPIGAIPEGSTIWYFRAGLSLPFIVSPDGYSLKKTGQVSLMSRMASMNAIIDAIEGRIIARLPFSNTFYKISTGGKEFDR